MGVFSFYIDIKADENVLNSLMNIYNANPLFQTAFHFARFTDEYDGKFNAGISSYIDNFLPANHLIYKFLSSVDVKCIYMKTNGIERNFDFPQKSDFISFMYTSWENRLDYAYRQYGTILINVKKYRQSRNKLYWRYYKKIF